MKTEVIAFLLAMILSFFAVAADVPQFRGPNRDGRFDETGLMKSWPDGGPPVLWVATDLGEGYSSVSVVGDRIYVTGANEGLNSQLVVLDTDGEVVMRVPYGKEADCSWSAGSSWHADDSWRSGLSDLRARCCSLHRHRGGQNSVGS